MLQQIEVYLILTLPLFFLIIGKFVRKPFPIVCLGRAGREMLTVGLSTADWELWTDRRVKTGDWRGEERCQSWHRGNWAFTALTANTLNIKTSQEVETDFKTCSTGGWREEIKVDVLPSEKIIANIQQDGWD